MECRLSQAKRRFSQTLKRLALRLVPDSTRARYVAHLPLLRRWRERYEPERCLFATRFELYDHLNRSVLSNAAIEYLEFGVYRGASIRRWAEINTHEDSRFIGFDTFEGLPETWEHFLETSHAGLYDTGGEAPRIDDPRVRFVKGLFQATLPGFLLSRTGDPGQLVLHLDADLYSSTKTVFDLLGDRVVPGTVIQFDEYFNYPGWQQGEYKAFQEFVESRGVEFEYVGYCERSYQVSVRILRVGTPEGNGETSP